MKALDPRKRARAAIASGVAKRSTAQQRAIAKALVKETKDADPRAVFALARELIDGGARQFAYEVLTFHRGARAAWTEADVVGLCEGNASWASVDHSGTCIIGPAWRDGVVKTATIARFARSDDRWLRRTALVATVALNNKARGATAPRGDAARTLAVCRVLVADRDDMVVKALSWALRELAKRDAAAVHGFMKEHGDRLAPRVRREVANKLETGLKNPRVRSRA